MRIALLCLLVACAPPPTAPQHAQLAASVLVRGAHVFDGERSLGVLDVALDGERIARVGVEIEVPQSTRVIDGRGKTLLPGLIARTDAADPAVTTVLAAADVVEIAGEALDEAAIAAAVAPAREAGKRTVVVATKLADVTAAVAAGADGVASAFADAPVDPLLAGKLQERGMFVIALLGGASPHAAASLGALRDAHVDLVVATAPKTTVHDALERLVAAGLTPEEALRAVTATPARRFGLVDRGRIADGLRADLILVEGNPVSDVTASRNVVAIWQGGASVPPAPPVSDGTSPRP